MLVLAAHVSGYAGPHPDLFYVLIPNQKTGFCYLKEREFYPEFQVFRFIKFDFYWGIKIQHQCCLLREFTTLNMVYFTDVY